MGDDSGQDAGPAISTDTGHNARVWDYWLQGKSHYEVDAEVGNHIATLYPEIVEVARADRAFLGRAVAFLAGEAGVRQFLDIGTGLPTARNTHEVAQEVAPESRIVYVDNDPIVLAHARALLTSSAEGATQYIDADAHDPATIIEAAGETLDFGKPVAVMFLGVLNFVLDTGRAAAIVRQFADAVPSGSYVALTHPTLELGGDVNREAMAFWNEHAQPPITARPRADLADFLTGLDILPPGIVSCSRWRPVAEENPPAVAQYAAVARKP
ncbi:SAM-dependent methyltransferase [Streptomyces sp. NPDC050560]|uniref:SAM-dependent methyltransferase n=1 Tax=Streptomyces sp. NPDC050560 TaxID=3365630 RepID=UPI0037A1B606